MTDRVIVWAGQIPLETDVLRSNKFAMTGIAKLAAAILGTSGSVVNGLTCVPTGPATLTVNVNPGEIYSLVSMDATAYSSVAADTTHQILKSGILLDAVNLSCPAPGTAGNSINYLVQAIFQESDISLVALPYYNASNPTQAWSGPNNSGTPQATIRSGAIVLSAKAGAAATTGSQVTPTPDAGWTGLWVVTVANGQTQIVAGSITQYAGAPILPSSLLASIQNGNLSYAVATGTANAHVITLTPAITQRVDGMVIRYKAPAANTGALTLNDGLGAVAVVGAAHSAMQGGETAANGDVWVQWNSSIGGGSYVMLDSTGGALQIAPATASQHALQLGQATGRLLKRTVFTTSGTFTSLAATNNIRAILMGGGGAGGGAQATSSGQNAFGSGGSSGAYTEIGATSGFSGGIAVTIGAGGVPVSGANGGNGGQSSLGALATAPGGGGGGQGLIANTTNGISLAAVSATPGTAGAVTYSIISGGTSLMGGIGIAGSIAGAGGAPGYQAAGGGVPTNSGVGNPATGYGGGGGGAASAPSTAARLGGSGAPGIVIVEEYA